MREDTLESEAESAREDDMSSLGSRPWHFGRQRLDPHGFSGPIARMGVPHFPWIQRELLFLTSTSPVYPKPRR